MDMQRCHLDSVTESGLDRMCDYTAQSTVESLATARIC